MDIERRYEWAVHNMSGLFTYGEDEAAARDHAEESGSELLRRPMDEWEPVNTSGDADDVSIVRLNQRGMEA